MFWCGKVVRIAIFFWGGGIASWGAGVGGRAGRSSATTSCDRRIDSGAASPLRSPGRVPRGGSPGRVPHGGSPGRVPRGGIVGCGRGRAGRAKQRHHVIRPTHRFRRCFAPTFAVAGATWRVPRGDATYVHRDGGDGGDGGDGVGAKQCRHHVRHCFALTCGGWGHGVRG